MDWSLVPWGHLVSSGYHLLLSKKEKWPVFTGHALAGKQCPRESMGAMWGILGGLIPATDPCVLCSYDGQTLALGSNMPLPSGDFGLGCSEGLFEL